MPRKRNAKKPVVQTFRTFYTTEVVPYSFGCLGSLSVASNVLLAQYQYPYEYDERDALGGADSDRCIQWDYNHATGVIKKYTGTGDQNLPSWFQGAGHERIMDLLKEILKSPAPDPKTGCPAWTGFQILGHVHRGNGYSLCSLGLFGKHPDTKTKVYGMDTPALNRKKRYVSNDGGWGGSYKDCKEGEVDIFGYFR